MHKPTANRLYFLLLLTLLSIFSTTVESYVESPPADLTEEEIAQLNSDEDDGLEGRLIEETFNTRGIEQPWVPIITHAITSVDMVFLIDGSASVNYYQPQNFRRIKSWIKRVASAFDLSTTLMRMGVVQYSHYYHVLRLSRQKFIKTEIKLGQCGSKACFDTAVDRIKYMGYTTYTGKAIQKVVDYDMKLPQEKDEKLRIIVLLTDGPSSDPVAKVAKEAREKGYHFVAVGVGEFNRAELRQIATGDPNSRVGTLEVKSFLDLPRTALKVQQMIRNIFDDPTCTPLIKPMSGELSCSEANKIGSTCTYDCGAAENELITMVEGDREVTCLADPVLGASWSAVPSICGVCKASIDMNIILDSSSSIGDKDFLIMKNFLLRLVDTFKISPDDVQISMMRYNKHVYDLWDYNTYNNKADLLQAIYDIEYNGGGTYTTSALEYAYNNKFEESTGVRLREPHITMVITDGKSQDSERMPWVVDKLHKVSHVITIGIIDADINEIRMIASEPSDDYAFTVENSFTELLNITQKLSETICNVQNDVVQITCPTDQLFNPSICFELECDDQINDPNNQYGVGTVCKAKCCPGWQLIGNDSVSCQYDATWTQPEYECVEKSCPAVQQTVGLQYFCTSDTGNVGTVCEMFCVPGFKMIVPPITDNCKVENGEMKCMSMCVLGDDANPKWDYPFAMCEGAEECDSMPCQNGGECTNLPGDFICECPDGFYGKMCELNMDDCILEPCLNGGWCQDLDNDYLCLCPSGYKGKNCEEIVDNCASGPCKYGSVCTNAENDYTCECTAGFEGKDCDVSKVCKEEFDLLFIMDSSSSMGHHHFAMVRNFIKAMVMSLAIGPKNVQVALIKYTDTVQEIWNYNTHTSQIDMFMAVDSITYEGEGTMTGQALTYALTNIVTDGVGRRPWAPHLTVLLTDGKAQDDVIIPASLLKKLSKILVLAVGDEPEAEEIKQIASEPADMYAKTLKSFDELVNLQLLIGYELCEVQKDYVETRCPAMSPASDCEGIVCTNDNVVGSECTMFCCEGSSTPIPVSTCQYDGSWSAPLMCFDIDECASSPCENGALCINGKNSYECQCLPGYVGDNCETDEDNCVDNDMCMNGGTCVDKVNAFECECEPGFIGFMCETNVDECTSMPCLNNGICIDGVASFQCLCEKDFSGERCETAVCRNDTCNNRGLCMADEKGIQCLCDNGFKGDRCEIEVDPCEVQPCLRGTCVKDFGQNFGFKCDCPLGFDGLLCENDIDECESNPCSNGASCDQTPTPGSFICTCLPGYVGDLCDDLFDFCNPLNPCQNGAKCTPLLNDFTCTCPPGWTGKDCSEDTNECELQVPFCNKNQKCLNTPGGYECLCLPGYTGDDCLVDIDDCSDQCLNGAKCIDGVNDYSCQCAMGFIGKHCEVDIDECQFADCKNGAQCIDGVNSYTCECAAGYEGPNCENDVDDCQNVKCENGGTCKDGVNNFECICPVGFSGLLCEINNDDCFSDQPQLNPCQNDGLCIDGVNSYTCICNEAFKGDNCEELVSLCEIQQPCKNGGICVPDAIIGFKCNCPEGFSGDTCESTFCPKDNAIGTRCQGTGGEGTVCTLECPAGMIPIQQVHGILTRNVVTTRTCRSSGTWDGPADGDWGCVPSGCPTIDETPLDTYKDNYDLNAIRNLDLFVEVTTTPAPTTTPKPWVMPMTTGPQKVVCTNDDNIGSICSHTCTPGYTLIGSSQRECLLSGEWSGQAASCQRTSCGVPYAEQIQYQTCTNGDLPNSYCHISCPPGMSIFGTTYKTCGYDLQWQPATPWGCAKTTCDKPLPTLTNGYLRCSDGNNAKSECIARCNPGFIRLGSSKVVCSYNGLDLDWRGDTNFQCVRAPCDKTIDLGTGVYTGFKKKDYAFLVVEPYRSVRENSWSMYGKVCNMKAVVGIFKSEKTKVKVDFWYDYFPSMYHLDMASVYKKGIYVKDQVLGHGKQLMTNLEMKASNGSRSAAVLTNTIPNYFQPLTHSTFTFGDNKATFSNNRGLEGEIGPSQLLGDLTDNTALYLGFNRMVNSNFNVGQGNCYVCINEY